MSMILLIVMNIAIMIVANIAMSIMQSMGIISMDSQSVSNLMVFFALIGFGGAYLSLFMSKMLVKRSMGVRVIDTPNNSLEHWYVNEVHAQCYKANLPIPEIGIFEGSPNAFATGATKSSSLVAISTGLLNGMQKNEISAVIAHELSHINNGDMATMTLLQGLVNTFVMLFSHLIGRAIDRVIFKSNRDGIGYFAGRFIAQMLLTVVASIILMAYSRWREYRADAGGARLAGKQNMIGALQALQNSHTKPLPDEERAFGIVGFTSELFLTHPPLSKRIAKLREQQF